MFLSSIGFLLPHMLLYVPETVLLPGFGTIGTSLCVIFLRLFNITIKVVCLQGFSFYFSLIFLQTFLQTFHFTDQPLKTAF